MRRALRSMSLLLAVLLGVAGCSGSHSSTGSGTPSTPSGPVPIVIGLVNTEDAPVGSFPDLRRGAVAATDFVNAAGGVDGHKLELVPCATDGTPESSQACANKLLQRHPVVVIAGVDLGAAASLPPLQSAHVPYVGGTPAATEALTSGGSFMLTGGTATEVLAEVGYAADTLHVTRMTVIYADVPGLLSTAATLLTTIAHKKGVTQFKLVPVEGATPDLVPSLSAVASGHPQAVIAVFPAQDCTRVVQGVAAVGMKTTMMYPSFCGAHSVLAAGGSSIDGSIIASGYLPFTDTGDADVRTYLSAVTRYDSSLAPSLLSQAGFSDVVVLRDVLSGITGPVTAASVSAALQATRDHANFMSHPFSCDGKQIPLLKALCNAYAHIDVVHNGTLQPVGDWIDTAPIARLVG